MNTHINTHAQTQLQPNQLIISKRKNERKNAIDNFQFKTVLTNILIRIKCAELNEKLILCALFYVQLNYLLANHVSLGHYGSKNRWGTLTECPLYLLCVLCLLLCKIQRNKTCVFNEPIA